MSKGNVMNPTEEEEAYKVNALVNKFCDSEDKYKSRVANIICELGSADFIKAVELKTYYIIKTCMLLSDSEIGKAYKDIRGNENQQLFLENPEKLGEEIREKVLIGEIDENTISQITASVVIGKM